MDRGKRTYKKTELQLGMQGGGGGVTNAESNEHRSRSTSTACANKRAYSDICIIGKPQGIHESR